MSKDALVDYLYTCFFRQKPRNEVFKGLTERCNQFYIELRVEGFVLVVRSKQHETRDT